MLHLHWYREGAKRRIVQTGCGGHQPVCRSWVETGQFPKSPVPSSLVKPVDAARSAVPRWPNPTQYSP
jgi:hypothetical protein